MNLASSYGWDSEASASCLRELQAAAPKPTVFGALSPIFGLSGFTVPVSIGPSMKPGVAVEFPVSGSWYRFVIPAGAAKNQIAMVKSSELARIPGPPAK